MAILALGFLNPFLLGGLALASLPVIIHLLNRRRFKTLDWAAMDFLLQAAVRNRKRIRLENLLLLLVRTLVVVFLVLAVARPFIRRGDAFASLFGGGSGVERVILLDDSQSMRAGQGSRSAFEKAKDLVASLVKRLHEERSSDRITLLSGTAPRDGAEGLVRVAVASSHANRLLERLKALKPTDGRLDLPGAIDMLLDRKEASGRRTVLYVVSDFRRTDWENGDKGVDPHVAQAVERFRKRGEVRLIDVGSPPEQNAGIVDLHPLSRAVVAGVPSEFAASVRNYGPNPLSGLSVVFRFGEVSLPPLRLDRTLAPGETAQITAEYTFRKEGPAVLSAALPTDVLPADDTRRITIDVRRKLHFLLVDGQYSQEPYRGETDYLAAALAPAPESGIAVDVVPDYAFAGAKLESYDGVFLCNVYRVPDETVKALEQFVAAGGGLVFFLGDQVDPQVYNATFFGSGQNAGKGLLPLRLVGKEGSTEDYVHFQAPSFDHPVVRFLRGLNAIVLKTISIVYYVRCEPPADDSARVILRYTDKDASPALAEKRYGKGRVLLYTTAADQDWSNFPRSPIYLALMEETARYVTRPDPGERNLLVSDPLRLAFDAQQMRRQALLVPPPELGEMPVGLTLSGDGEGALGFRYDRTRVCGVYTLRLTHPDGGKYELPFCVNLDPREGDLSRANTRRLAEALPGVTLERAEESSLARAEQGDRTEFWRTLILLLVAFAVLETFLAWKFGHHDRTGAEAGGKQVFLR